MSHCCGVTAFTHHHTSLLRKPLVTRHVGVRGTCLPHCWRNRWSARGTASLHGEAGGVVCSVDRGDSVRVPGTRVAASCCAVLEAREL